MERVKPKVEHLSAVTMALAAAGLNSQPIPGVDFPGLLCFLILNAEDKEYVGKTISNLYK